MSTLSDSIKTIIHVAINGNLEITTSNGSNNLKIPTLYVLKTNYLADDIP